MVVHLISFIMFKDLPTVYELEELRKRNFKVVEMKQIPIFKIKIVELH